MINLEWFRTFKAIYEAGTLSAAARALFMSQPGVTQHLSSLEAYTGDRLFDRNTRRLNATEKGNFLYSYIIEHLNKLEEAEHIFHKRRKSENATVSAGMSQEIFQYILESHVPDLPFNLITRFGDYPQMLQELNNGSLDLILTAQRGSQHNLEYIPFCTEKIVLVCGGMTDTKKLEKLLLEDDRNAVKDWLTTQVWYATDAGMEPLKRFWSASFNCFPVFRANYVVPYYGAILRCLSNNRGFAVVPDFLCRREIAENKIKLVWEGIEPIEDTLYFCKRKTTAFSKEIEQLQTILSELACL